MRSWKSDESSTYAQTRDDQGSQRSSLKLWLGNVTPMTLELTIELLDELLRTRRKDHNIDDQDGELDIVAPVAFEFVVLRAVGRVAHDDDHC